MRSKNSKPLTAAESAHVEGACGAGRWVKLPIIYAEDLFAFALLGVEVGALVSKVGKARYRWEWRR